MRNNICAISILLLNITLSFGQDFIFSQYDANPLFVNPALTGERTNEYNGIHFNVNYKDQTANYSKNAGTNKTFAAGVDLPINDKFSIGQYFGNNNSPDGIFNTFNFLLSGAYKIISPSQDNNRHNLSVGLQMGVLNSNVNTKNFIYASQYSPTSADGFDRSISSGETFSQQSFFKFDYNAGIYYRTKLKGDKMTVASGFSLYHIGKSLETNTLEGSFTSMRTSLHFNLAYKLNEKIEICPSALYINQAKAQGLNIGVLMNYKLNDLYQPILGLNIINNSSLVLQMGIKAKGTIIRMSYSGAVNSLKTYGNRGLEVSLTHNTQKKAHPVTEEEHQKHKKHYLF